jgi:nitrite reductase/ring-hydroxylating ferredoxin subunit
MSKISRRSMVGMITTGFVAFLFSPSAAGALNEPVIRAGDTCKKVGRRKTSGGKAFECVKTANGNTWRRAKASTPSQPTTSEVKVLDSASLSAGASQTAIVTSGGRNYAVVLTRTSGGVVAFSRSCTHAGALVTPGPAGQLTCPAHASVFSASTGAVIEGPANISLTRYQVSERSGAIYITI